MDLLGSNLAKRIELPDQVIEILKSCRSYTIYNSADELFEAATGGRGNNTYEVKYEITGKGLYTEAIVHRVNNGISVNYTEAYMRRRDPDTMVIADNLPTDKERFIDRFGYPFEKLQKETFDWLKEQDLAVFFYFAGRKKIGVGGIAIAPANAGFFALGLAMLQQILDSQNLPEYFKVESIIYVAPTFRHTHFNGKQIVVHNRTERIHEIYSYNLYPGPSAKKGLYGVLLNKGEKEGWITAHC